MINLMSNYSGSKRYIAHRGLSGFAPENTLAAFRLACNAGFWGVECDIQLSKDLDFVIIHDSSLNRLCGISESVSMLTINDIQKYLIISGNNIIHYPSEYCPSLREYLALLSQYMDIHPVIEIKFELTSELAVKLLSTVDEFFSRYDVYFISFSSESLFALKTLDSSLHLMYLSCDINRDIVDFCVENRFDLDVYFGSDYVDYVSYLHENNRLIGIWTVDDEDVAHRHLSETGIDFVTTNMPLPSIMADVLDGGETTGKMR